MHMSRPNRPRDVTSRTYKWTRALGTLLSLMVCFSARGGALPQRDSQGPQTETLIPGTAVAVRVDQGPKMDGTLNDALWLLAKTVSDFRQ